jgi:undecaprenyl-diphosphatase
VNIFDAIFLGLVQGITEVLPISSSGHLVLLPWFFSFNDPGLAFDVALHLGTLLAIIAYFWPDLLAIVKSFLETLKTRQIKDFNDRLPYFILLATIPGILAGYFLNNTAESVFRNPLLIASTTFFFGLVLIWAESYKKTKKIENNTYKSSFLTGLAQAIAIIPGVSRSGITISAGMFQGFSREATAKFSFLISVPIIAGAGLVEIRKIPVHEYTTLVFWAGLISAVVASFLSVKFLMNFIKSHKLNIFAYYRFGLAVLIIILYLWR